MKNKLYSVAFAGLGTLTVLLEGDATFLAFTLMAGILLFFSKKTDELEYNIMNYICVKRKKSYEN